MIEPKIEIQGLQELEKNLLALGADLGSKALTSALRDAADPFLDQMKQDAAIGGYGSRTVKTKGGSKVEISPGFMRSRIKKRAIRNRKGAASKKFDAKTTALVRVGVFRVPYAVQVEYGTSRSKAQPFVRPAADRGDEVVRLFKGRLQHRIKLAARRLARKQIKGKR